MEFSEQEEPREIFNKRNNYIRNLETKFSLFDLIFGQETSIINSFLDLNSSRERKKN